MATKEEIKEAKKKNKGVVVPAHLAKPYSPENIHLSKAQFIAKEKLRKEKDLKIAEFAENLGKEKKEEVPEVKEEKKTKRPKKIE